MLLHYYNVSAIILQVFLYCAQNLILHICYVVLLQHYVSIFKKRTFLRCCNIAAIFLQCCCNISVLYGKLIVDCECYVFTLGLLFVLLVSLKNKDSTKLRSNSHKEK